LDVRADQPRFQTAPDSICSGQRDGQGEHYQPEKYVGTPAETDAALLYSPDYGRYRPDYRVPYQDRHDAIGVNDDGKPIQRGVSGYSVFHRFIEPRAQRDGRPERIFWRRRYRRSGLPFPSIPFGTNRYRFRSLRGHAL